MRLICPRCESAYEIPARAIPPAGREVQCAACTHAWYQLAQTPPAQPAGQPRGPDAAPARDAASPPSEPAPPAEDVDSAAAPVTDPPAPPRRKLDPQVEAVLRAEAQREAQARRRESAAPLETQPDLGLEAPPRKRKPPGPPAEGIRERLARLQAAEAAQAARQGRWQPGEEEQNSPPTRGAALRTVPERPADIPTPAAAETAPTDRKTGPTPPPSGGRALTRQPGNRLPVALSPRELAVIEERRQRRGFRLGFGLTAGVCAAALALFLLAPMVMERLPASAPVLGPVVAGGEAVQSRLASGMRASLEALSGLTAPEG